MTQLGRLIGRFSNDERGATAIEYGLIAALMAVAAIAAMMAFGGGLNNIFAYVSGRSVNAMSGG